MASSIIRKTTRLGHSMLGHSMLGHSMQSPKPEMKRPAATSPLVFCVALAAVLLAGSPAWAQSQRTAPTPQPPRHAAPAIGGQVSIPGFWDPKRRPERPDMSRITVIRFMTEVDYPP